MIIMNNIRHIHEVLFLFQKEGSFDNEEVLFTSIKGKFGEDVSFISCSKKPFGLEEVVPFLTKREKIVQNADGSLTLHPNMTMCDGHEDGHHHH